MKLQCESVVSLLLFLGVGLSTVGGQHEEEWLSLMKEGIQALSDDSRIIFEDWDEDGDLHKEIQALEEEERAFKKEESLYKRELDEFMKNKSRHEDEMAEFQEEKLLLGRKLKEYEKTAKKDNERLQAESDELEAEENTLTKLRKEVDQEEKELEDLENLRKMLMKDAEEEEKRLQANHGVCIDTPESLKNLLQISENEISKLCYSPIMEDKK